MNAPPNPHKGTQASLQPLTSVTLVVTSGILLGLTYSHSALFALAWIALVPLFWVWSSTQSPLNGWLSGTLFGIALYATGTFWVADYVLLLQGWSASASLAAALPFWLYSAQVWGLAGLILVALQARTRLPSVILTPTIIATISLIFPHLFEAPLAVTQTRFSSILQGISVTGSVMLDWLIVAINMTIFQTLRGRLGHQPCTRLDRNVALGVLGLLLIWLGYGVINLSLWQQRMQTWPRATVAAVQPNQFPQKARHSLIPGFSHSWSPELAMSERLTLAQPELIVWPEAHSRDYFNDERVRAAYQRAVERWQIPLLFQAVEPRATRSTSASSVFNSAVLLTPDQTGEAAVHEKVYRKVNRVPIGEYVPALLTPLARKLTPWLRPFKRPMAAGSATLVQPTQSGLRVLPLICYDVLFASFVADAVPPERENLLIVTLSNDGWFGQLAATRLHTRLAALRAIENRVPLLHAVNNGPSAYVTVTGVIQEISPHLAAGGYLTEIALPAQAESATPYSQRPRLVPFALISITLIGITLSLVLASVRGGQHRQS